MKVCIIWPAIYMGFNTLGKGFEQSSINHGLASISALIKSAGHDSYLIDMRGLKSWEEFENIIKLQNFDACLIGFYSVDSTHADKAIEIVKKYHPGKPLIAGGVHITYNQLESFSKADCIVWGEGETVILDILKKVQAGESLPPKVIAPIVKDLDSIPDIDRRLFGGREQDLEKNHPLLPLLPTPNYTVNFSRGCPGSCSFCLESKNILFKGYRTRSPERCIEELKRIRLESGAELGSLMIHDDLFPPGKWCKEFIHLWHKNFKRIPFWCQMRADQIVRNPESIIELANMGMTWVSLGIEGSEQMREFYNKKISNEQLIESARILHDNDVNIFGNYIIGSPTETEVDLKELCTLLSQIRPEWHSQSMYTAYPGSKLYDYCIENNLFVGDGTKESDYYSMMRYPYHRKVVGVDYKRLEYWGAQMMKHKGPLRQFNSKGKIMKPVPKKVVAELHGMIEQPCKDHKGKPKVSIIMTSYNRPTMVKEAIQSVLDQTIKNWELIIVDDCSTNPQVMPILKQAAKDYRIKLYQVNYDVNNISVEWNLGIEKSSGEYIALLDDDNHKLPDFCKKMSEYLDTHPEKDAVACYFYIMDNDGKHTGGVFDDMKDMTKENILEKNYVDSGSMMWRRSVMDRIGWFDERLKTTEDWDFVIRLVHESKGFGIIEEKLAEYRWHHENRTFVARGLGLQLHKQFITDIKPYQRVKDVIIFHEDRENITLSQRNVLDGITDAFKTIPDLQVRTVAASQSERLSKCDYIFVFAPFAIKVEKLAQLRKFAREVMFFHCEDPQAIIANLERAKYADFISTNDIAAIPMLETVVGRGNVAYCPSISVNTLKLKARSEVKKVRDILFVGYPYKSRKEFAKKLLPKLDKYGRSRSFKVAFIGDGWKEYLREINSFATAYDTTDEQTTMEMMEESKIVLLYNRQATDGGGENAIKPKSVVRGYFECASGSTVMLDDSREHHNLENNVVFYRDANHADALIAGLLDSYKDVMEIRARRRAKAIAITYWTYKERIKQLFNIFRNRRFFQEIK